MSFHSPMQTTQEAGGSFLPEDDGPSHSAAGEEPMSTEARPGQTPRDISSITADHSYTITMSKQKVTSCCSAERNVLPTYKNSLTDEEKTVKRSKSAVTYKALSLHVVNRRNRFGESLLHTAVQQGDIQKLQDILKLQPDVNMTDNAGWTALHEAVLRNQYEASLHLINAGALINTAAQNGVTPLHDAVRDGHERIAKLLLKHGANPLLKTKDGQTAFDINTEPSLRVPMLKNIPKDSPFAGSGNTREETSVSGTITTRSQSSTAERRKSGPSKAPQHLGPDQPRRSNDSNRRSVTSKQSVAPIKNVHRRNCYGETLLHKAAIEGNTPRVRQLLQLGADVNMPDNAGWTPLHEAALGGHYDIIVDLIKAGALVNATAQNGEMPLQDAIFKGHTKIANELLKHGATLEPDDEGGQITAFLQRPVEDNRRQLLPALTHQDSAGEESRDDAQLDQEEEVSLNPQKTTDDELNREPNDTEMGQTVVSPAVDNKQENQKKSITSLNVRADPPLSAPLPLLPSPPQPSTPSSPQPSTPSSPQPSTPSSPQPSTPSPPQPRPPCCVPAPPNSQLCSTPVCASWIEEVSEEEDSEQTMDYNSSDESVDWAVQATQNFNLLSAHDEETFVYTFPTEMV